MAAAYVMVERATSGALVRVGEILSDAAVNTYLVDWHSEPPVNVKISRLFTRTIFGSARFLQLADPSALADLFSSSPERIFIEALYEISKSATAPQIREKAVGYGLPATDVEAAWKRVQRQIEAMPEIEKTAAKYRWRGTALEFPQYVPPVPGNSFDNRTSTVDAQAADTTLADEESVAEARSPRENAVGPGSSRSLAQTHFVDTVKKFLSGDRLADDTVKSLSSAPLAMAIEAARIADGNIAKAGNPSTSSSVFVLYAIAAASPRANEILDSPGFRAWLAASPSFSVLQAAAEEYLQVNAERRRKYDAHLRALTARIGSAAVDRNDSIGAWLTFLSRFKQEQSEAIQYVRNVAVDALAAVLRANPATVKAVTKDEWNQLAIAVSEMPFEVRGGRSGLLRAIQLSQPKQLESTIWWRGLTFEVASLIGDGDLSAALRQPVIADTIVVPVIAQKFADLSSRRSLGAVFTSASSIAERILPSQVRAAFERSAKDDPSARAWYDELSNSARLARAREDASAAAAALASEQSTARELRAQLDRADAALSELRAEISKASDSNAVLRGQETRQIQIDTVRTLAQLALMIETESDKLDPAALIARTRAFAARQGLRPIGSLGETSLFDAATHEAPGERPESGSRVNVIRPGYEWVSGDETLVLQKAQVSMNKGGPVE